MEDFPEFDNGVRSLARSQIGCSAEVGRIEIAEKAKPTAWHSPFVRSGELQQVDGTGGVALVKQGERSKNRHISEIHAGVFRKATFKVVCERLRSRQITEIAAANAAPYSTSRAFESASAAVTLRPASDAFPKNASRTAAPAEHGRPFFLASLSGETYGAARHRPGRLKVPRKSRHEGLCVRYPVLCCGLLLSQDDWPFHSARVASKRRCNRAVKPDPDSNCALAACRIAFPASSKRPRNTYAHARLAYPGGKFESASIASLAS